MSMDELKNMVNRRKLWQIKRIKGIEYQLDIELKYKIDWRM